MRIGFGNAGAARERVSCPRFSIYAPELVGGHMLRWAIGFLVLALIAALLGFGGFASTSAGIAKTLFIVFLVIAAVTFILGRAGPRRMP